MKDAISDRHSRPFGRLSATSTPWTRLRAVATLGFVGLVSCSDNQHAEQETEATATLVLPLETIADSGIRYQLRDATFTITSNDENEVEKVVSTDDRLTQEIRVELNPGPYDVEIESEVEGFHIVRINDDLSTETVDNVELLSDPVQTVELVEGIDTRVVYRFLVDGITLGFGDLVLEIEVEERAGAGGDTSSGGNGGNASGGSPPVGGGGSGASGGEGNVSNPECESCLDANLPENLNQNCTAITECGGVRDCVVESNCFQTGGSPSVCFCGVGVDINACIDPNFVPTGACVDEIRAAMTLDGIALDNATVVGLMAAATTTSGQAFGILIPATNFGICIDECSL